MAFDPSWDAIQHALYLSGVVADGDASDDRAMMGCHQSVPGCSQAIIGVMRERMMWILVLGVLLILTLGVWLTVRAVREGTRPVVALSDEIATQGARALPPPPTPLPAPGAI